MKYLLSSLIAMMVIVAQAVTIYVDVNATGANNGTSWTDAFTVLQSGVSAANSNDLVLVNDGEYFTTADPDPGYVAGRTDGVPFIIKSVNGKSSTIIDGGGVRRGFNFRCNNPDFNGVADLRVEIDGFTVKNCLGTSDGSAVLLAIVKNCDIHSSYTGRDGAGVKECRVYNTRIWDCHATEDGGGGAFWSFLYNVEIFNCSASTGGGIAYPHVMINCDIHHNTISNDYGAGVRTWSYSYIINSRIHDNYGPVGGGVGGGDIKLMYGCALYNNSSESDGGAFQGVGPIINCTIVSNTCTSGPGVYITDIMPVSLINNIIRDNNTQGYYDSFGGYTEGPCDLATSNGGYDEYWSWVNQYYIARADHNNIEAPGIFSCDELTQGDPNLSASLQMVKQSFLVDAGGEVDISPYLATENQHPLIRFDPAEILNLIKKDIYGNRRYWNSIDVGSSEWNPAITIPSPLFPIGL